MKARIEEEPLPQTFADGMDCFERVFLPHDPWFKTYEGNHVAILGGRIVMFDPDPHYLAHHIREQFPGTIIYMPHVVRLPATPEPSPKMATLPHHFLRAIKYYEFLRNDPAWLQAHMGRRIAIIGQQVVDEQTRGEEWNTFSDRVYTAYGYRDLFMPEVTQNYPLVVTLHPRGTTPLYPTLPPQ